MKSAVGFHPDLVGKANGNGPVHLLLLDQSLTLCGRTRFSARSRTGYEAAGQPPNCKYCLGLAYPRQMTRRKRPGFSAGELSRLEGALAEIRAARQVINEVATGGWWPPTGSPERARFTLWLSSVHKLGVTFDEIAKLFGCSRERIRQLAAESQVVATRGA